MTTVKKFCEHLRINYDQVEFLLASFGVFLEIRSDRRTRAKFAILVMAGPENTHLFAKVKTRSSRTGAESRLQAQVLEQFKSSFLGEAELTYVRDCVESNQILPSPPAAVAERIAAARVIGNKFDGWTRVVH